MAHVCHLLGFLFSSSNDHEGPKNAKFHKSI